MTSFLLPDTIAFDAAKRLRAMAESLEAGMTLTEVAVRFHIPTSALHKVAASKRRRPPTRKVPAISERALANATQLALEGKHFRDIAGELGVAFSTLDKALRKQGVTMGRSQPHKVAQALELYRKGMTVTAICKQVDIGITTLYRHIGKAESLGMRQKHAAHPKRKAKRSSSQPGES